MGRLTCWLARGPSSQTSCGAAVLWCLVLGLGAPAFAQRFDDDFEPGTLLTSDGGKWNQIVGSGAIAASQVAAHQYAHGLLVPAGAGALYVQAGDPVSGADRFLRYWVDVPPGSAGAVQMSELTPGMLQVRLGWLADGGATAAVGLNGTYSAPASIQPGSWHLIETALTGCCGSGSRQRMWVDAVQAADVSGVASVTPTGIELGRLAVTAPFNASLAFDSVHLWPTPLANREVYDAGPGPFAIGSCYPLTLDVQNYAGAYVDDPLGAGWTFHPRVPDSFELFSDSTCQTPFQPGFGVIVSAGNQPRTLWFQEPTACIYQLGSWDFSDDIDLVRGQLVLPVGSTTLVCPVDAGTAGTGGGAGGGGNSSGGGTGGAGGAAGGNSSGGGSGGGGGGSAGAGGGADPGAGGGSAGGGPGLDGGGARPHGFIETVGCGCGGSPDSVGPLLAVMVAAWQVRRRRCHPKEA